MFNKFLPHGLFEGFTDTDKNRRSAKLMRHLRRKGFTEAAKEVKKQSKRKQRRQGKLEEKE